jgi:membrane fusion protein (multidrug efflux system)
MARRMIIMLIALGILFGAIFSYQAFKGIMMKKYMAKNMSPPVAVATMKVQKQKWQSSIKASGSLRAVKGVDVTTELAGLVRTIHFKPGADVVKDTKLIQLNDDAEVAQLQSLVAAAQIAKITFDRDKAQLAIKAVSQQTLDNDAATLKGALAQVEQQKATVDKKLIRAPFSGKLGISQVNPGQYINPGDKLVTLQTLDPIYVDFYIPQQALNNAKVGQPVIVTSDTYPGVTYKGKITTIDPKVDVSTRNVQVEATIENPKKQLFPGMFTTVELDTGKPKDFFTLPQTAISYNPYGEIIYLVKEAKNDSGKTELVATQTFVTTGESRGDQVVVLKGLNEGDTVVVSGQLKLKNGSVVTVNNSVMPQNEANPTPINE